MSKEQKLLYRKLKKDYFSGISKLEAFRGYKAASGSAIRGSLFLATYVDKDPDLHSFKLSKLFLFYFWISFGALTVLSINNAGEFGILIGMLWPAAATVLILRKNIIGYIMFGWFLIQDILDVFIRLDAPIWFVASWVCIFSFAIYVLVRAKLRMFPYQSLFHMKKNKDGTFVFTNEVGYQSIEK